MALARWQATVVDEAGNVLPAAQVTVRREISGAPLAVLYADRDGLTPLGNPFPADADGFAAFHAVGGAYRIDAVSGSSTRTWRYVPVGLAAESDAVLLDISYLFSSTVTDSDPGSGVFRFNNATLGSVTQIFFDNLDDLGSDVSSWLDRLDDAGSTTDRGSILIRAIDGSAEFVGRVTGSVTNGSGYRKVVVTPLATVGTFADSARVGVSFSARGANGADGTGTVNGPGTSSEGNVPVFANGVGTLLSDSGSRLVGRQTAYIPAGAMVPATTNGAFYSEVTHGDFTLGVLLFDGTTSESATFHFKAPKGWDEGTLSYEAEWFHGLTTTNFGVSWKLSGVALSDGSNLGTATGTEIELAVTGGVQNQLYHTGQSALLTLADQSPAIMEEDTVLLKIRRDPVDAQDTMTIDAALLGITIYYNTTRNTDD